MQVLQRDDWNHQPRRQGETFCLRKGRLTAECELWSHPLRWELRLDAGKEFMQTAVCKSQDEVLSTSENWKAAMQAKGWR